MNSNNEIQAAVTATQPERRRVSLPLIILAVLFIIVPFLTWYGTWFGRKLSDEDIATYLADEKNPRRIQHALSRIEERIEGGDPTVKKFYPQVVALTKSPFGEIRKTTAWVMGQDNTSEEFHACRWRDWHALCERRRIRHRRSNDSVASPRSLHRE